MFPDKLDLVSQELVKLAKDNGSSDNISIVVVFLKPIEELAAMELPIDTKDLDTISQNGTNNMMNNNEKEALYDGITSTSIYVGKNSIEVRLFLRLYQNLVKLTFLINGEAGINRGWKIHLTQGRHGEFQPGKAQYRDLYIEKNKKLYQNQSSKW